MITTKQDTRQDRHQDRRLEILQAARTCLAQYGYAKTSMEGVGKCVGLNKASLYYYFPNKESLVAEAIANASKDAIQALQSSLESTQHCSQRLTTYLVQRFQIYERIINLHNLSMQDLRLVGPTLVTTYKACKQRETDFIQTLLEYCVRQGDLPPCDTARIAQSIAIIADGYKNQVISNPDTPLNAPIDYSVVHDDLVHTVTLLLNGVKASAP